MKNLIVFALIMLFLSSCSHDNSEHLDPVSENQIKNFKNLSEDDKRVAYLLLDKTERYVVWKEGLESYLNDSVLTVQQINILSDLKNTITPEVFADTPNNYQAYFKNIYVPQILITIQQNFSLSQTENYFYRMPSKFTKYRSSSGSNCNCNDGSMFGCGMTNDCTGINCSNPKTTGCGFIGAWECNRKCFG